MLSNTRQIYTHTGKVYNLLHLKNYLNYFSGNLPFNQDKFINLIRTLNWLP